MRNLSIATMITLILSMSSAAFAGRYFSSHFCQNYRSGGVAATELYYQNQGSIYAAKDLTVTCPLSADRFDHTGQIRLMYATNGVTATQPIVCRVFKISVDGFSSAGDARTGTPGLQSGVMDLLSDQGPASPVGANIECRLKAGTKILGYFLYE